MRYAELKNLKKVNESEMNDLVYFNKEQLDKSMEEVEAYKQHHIEDGWKNIELENPPENDSEATKDELVTITNIQAKRTKEDENSIYVSDNMDSFHFREYLNANDLDYSSAEITAIIDDVWKATRTFKNKFNRPRPYQMAEAYNMEFETMHGESNKTPAYPSGHSCGATLLALYLSKKHPEHKEQFKDIAEKIGIGRIQAGFHYPSDHVSGVDLAFKVFPYLKISEQHLDENFADGKNPERKGLSKRVGVSQKMSISQLEKIAKNSTGERRKMAQWNLNMKRGRK